MSRRATFVACVIATSWLTAIARRGFAGYLPQTMGIERLAYFVVPNLVLVALALFLARRWGLFTLAELGLEPSAWQRNHPLANRALLLGLFAGFALAYMAPPISHAIASGLSYPDFLDGIRQHEYRSTLRAYEPLDATGLALSFFDGSMHAPLAEEVPYRALLVPLALPFLGRRGTLLASGVIFFLTHWIAYQQGANPQHFLTGMLFAHVFLRVGLAGALAAHAGGNAGVWLLAAWVAHAGP